MKSFKIIDISWPIKPGMTEYKDQAKVEFVPTKTIVKNSAREHDILLTTHTGTHVDAPAHFLEKGKYLDDLPLSSFIGQCRVLDLTNVQCKITKSDLINLSIDSGEIILLKTKNSLLDCCARASVDFIYLDADAALFLASNGIKAVGIDYLGIERGQPGHETHKALLEVDIVIIEGLRLKDVLPGIYFLSCLPIKLNGLEAAPTRAVLIDWL
ncbi:MAG: Kynurenine formamidase [candidate division TM6 bacterium GW2011_GWF2_37_49]|nr:MAG: Kynurenine formamidase [candidate division TM6 bacterium GW2011_GWF2_37_49]